MSLTTAIGCETRRVLRAAYLDLDGTLLGRGASLFLDADGAFTLLGARALEACARAEVEVVPYSGRRQSTLLHDARMLGLSLLHLRGGLRARARRRARVADRRARAARRQDDPRPDRGVGRAGAAARALRGAARGLRAVARRPRGVAALPRATTSTRAEADELLIEGGFGDLRLVDNGVMHGVDGGSGRAYHLIPRAASKARAVARHMQARGLRARGRHRRRRLDGGPRRGGGRGHVLARRQRDCAEVRDAARRSWRTCASPRRRTAPASTRRSSRSSPSGAEGAGERRLVREGSGRLGDEFLRPGGAFGPEGRSNSAGGRVSAPCWL